MEVEVMTRWRVDTVSLRPDTMIAASLPEQSGYHGVDGLLGSDELSWFRSVTTDHQRQVVTFDQS
jgi:hypothetical protein